MARIRTIKPEFPQSESMGRVSRDARLCFIMLWTIADDEGRLRGNSRMLASLLFPYDDDAKKHIEAWLDQLSNEGCIFRYEVDGTSYLQIEKWREHQKIDKPSASKIAPPSEQSRILANPREHYPLDQGSRIKDQGSRIKDQGEDQGSSCAEPPSDSTLDVPIITIPLVDKTEHPVSQAQLDEWVGAYPAVDVMQQLRSMRQWCLGNPTKQKTARGVNAFIVRWLSDKQDKPASQATHHNGFKPARQQLIEGGAAAIFDGATHV